MELFNRNYHAPGTKPGTLSSQDPTDFVIDSVVYDENQIQKHTFVLPLLSPFPQLWILLTGCFHQLCY
jgi:hypothetical protein